MKMLLVVVYLLAAMLALAVAFPVGIAMMVLFWVLVYSQKEHTT